jgi:hypothetical protein
VGFNTFYWHGCVLPTPELERARIALASATAYDGLQSSLRALLESNEEAAVAMALDHYARSESVSRQGLGSPFSSLQRLVLSRARDLLRSHQPPLGRAHGAAIEDATYASALGAMLNLAEGDDQALIADVLARSGEPSVRLSAALAATSALQSAAVPESRLLDELKRVALDPGADSHERQAAVNAIAATRGGAAAELLENIVRDADAQTQAAAALALLDIDTLTYRDTVRRAAARWPADTPHPADEVRDILDGSE